MKDLTVPGVLPVSARAWRVQQFRWTKGFVQCFIKLMPLVWTSPALPRWQKLMVSLQTRSTAGVLCWERPASYWACR